MEGQVLCWTLCGFRSMSAVGHPWTHRGRALLSGKSHHGYSDFDSQQVADCSAAPCLAPYHIPTFISSCRRLLNGRECAFSNHRRTSHSSCAEVVFQIFAVQSRDPVSTEVPSGEKTAETTELSWPLSVVRHSPEAEFQILAVSSHDVVSSLGDRRLTTVSTEPFSIPKSAPESHGNIKIATPSYHCSLLSSRISSVSWKPHTNISLSLQVKSRQHKSLVIDLDLLHGC